MTAVTSNHFQYSSVELEAAGICAPKVACIRISTSPGESSQRFYMTISLVDNNCSVINRWFFPMAHIMSWKGASDPPNCKTLIEYQPRGPERHEQISAWILRGTSRPIVPVKKTRLPATIVTLSGLHGVYFIAATTSPIVDLLAAEDLPSQV